MDLVWGNVACDLKGKSKAADFVVRCIVSFNENQMSGYRNRTLPNESSSADGESSPRIIPTLLGVISNRHKKLKIQLYFRINLPLHH